MNEDLRGLIEINKELTSNVQALTDVAGKLAGKIAALEAKEDANSRSIENIVDAINAQKTRVEKLEKTAPMNGALYNKLHNTICCRVYEMTPEMDNNERRKQFRDIHRFLRNFGLAIPMRDTPESEYDNVMIHISKWYPKG